MAILKKYNNPEFLRFWAQTVLPTLYDDSLSYYEILSKVVKWLNETIHQMEITQENLQTVNEALETLTADVRELEERVDVAEADISTLKAGLKSAEDRISAAETHLVSVEAKIAAQDSAISAIQLKNTDQDSAISAIQLKNTDQDSAIAENALKITEQGAVISQLENDYSSLTGRVINCETEASTAKATADGVDAKATEALEKATAAVALAGAGGVTFATNTAGNVPNFTTAETNGVRVFNIAWPTSLDVFVGGTRFVADEPFTISSTNPGITMVVLDKIASALSADSVHALPPEAVTPDSHIPLFAFNYTSPGFVFGYGCSFPLPFKVNGVLTNASVPRYFQYQASVYNDGTVLAPLNTSYIQYAPPGAHCIIVHSTNDTDQIPSSVFKYPVHVSLAAGNWIFQGASSTAVEWLSLTNSAGTPNITTAARNITFKGPVSGIKFSFSGGRIFNVGATNCVFYAGTVGTLTGSALLDCTFTGNGALSASAVLRGCKFNVNSSWELATGSYLYDCLAYAVKITGTVNVFGGYISPLGITDNPTLYLYNATFDCTIPDSGAVGVTAFQVDVHNCYVYTLSAPASTNPVLSGAGLTVPVGFTTNFDTTRISSAKFFPA